MKCVVCGKEIQKKCRRDTKYCCRAHQMVAYRERTDPNYSENVSYSSHDPSPAITNHHK